MCDFFARLAYMVLECVYLALLSSLALIFLGVTLFFNLVFLFMDSYGVMGSLIFVKTGLSDSSKLSEVISKRKNTTPKNPWSEESGIAVKPYLMCLCGLHNPRPMNGWIYNKA